MADRALFLRDRALFLAVPGARDAVLHLGSPVSRIERAGKSISVRLDASALPIASGALAATTAVLCLRALSGGHHDRAFAELLRATAPEGRAVIVEEDAGGTVGAEQRTAVAAGWVPSQMEAVAEARPDLVRLFVIFKPAADKSVSSERGHGTH